MPCNQHHAEEVNDMPFHDHFELQHAMGLPDQEQLHGNQLPVGVEVGRSSPGRSELQSAMELLDFHQVHCNRLQLEEEFDMPSLDHF